MPAIIGVTAAAIGITTDPSRWKGLLARVEMGFKGDSLEIVCRGIAPLEANLIAQGQPITPEIQQALTELAQSGKAGDSAAVKMKVMSCADGKSGKRSSHASGLDTEGLINNLEE